MTTKTSDVKTVTTATAEPAWKIWTGRVLSALPVLGLFASASMKLSHSADFLKMWVDHFGFQESSATPIGIVEILVAVLYAIPRTSALGAILITGYLGGAICTHVRVGDPFIPPLLLAIMVWAGLFLRDARVRSLIPFRAVA